MKLVAQGQMPWLLEIQEGSVEETIMLAADLKLPC